ncbi:DUF7824 domain-containing protein [Streptomyces uncialis]|uniref:DUF7824 domain-containing protein n=1 Tax=Streptomyces uncialis TaxID=1048205 RepID=UPI0033F6A3FE
MTTTDTLMAAVREGKVSAVIELVTDMTTEECRAAVPELKALRIELRKELWSNRARQIRPALHAAGAACHSGAAAAAAWIAGSEMAWAPAAPPVLLNLLAYRDRQWQADVAARLAARPESAGVPFALMSGLVRLSGCEVPTTDSYVRGWLNSSTTSWQLSGPLLAERLGRDAHLVPLVNALFELDDIGWRLEWTYGQDGAQGWIPALAQLTEQGFLDRKTMIDGCVARLLRGGSTVDQRAFLALFKALSPTREEERERTGDWMALATDAAVAIASHAQSVLAALALDGELTARQLAEMSRGVLFRPEKKLVRAQLVLLGKVLRATPSAASALLPAVAEGFGHPDTDLQERAVKLVERWAARADQEARDEILASAELLSGVLRPRAAAALGVVPAALEPAAPEVYEEILPPVPLARRVDPAPETVEELAEEVGALLAARTQDVAVFERVLDGLVRHTYRDREALVEALRPVVVGCWWYSQDGPGTYAESSFRARPHGVEVVLASLFDAVKPSTLHKALRKDGSSRSDCAHAKLERPWRARLYEAALLLRTGPPPFLLSTPTWASGLLEAGELVARLGEYRRLGAPVAEADFAQALRRVRHDATADPAVSGGAAAAAVALGTPEGHRLAALLTGPAPAAPAAEVVGTETRLLVRTGGVPELRSRELPAFFRPLGGPVDPTEREQQCYHWGFPAYPHWLAILPGEREAVAARLLAVLSAGAVDDIPLEVGYLPLLAESPGPVGDALLLSVAYGAGARRAEERVAAVDALLVLAASGQLDTARLGELLGQLMAMGAVKPVRVVECVRTAASTGACGTVWGLLRAALPALLAGPAVAGTAAARGVGDLLAVAAECVERAGGRGELPHLAELAARRGGSRLLTQARRLHTLLTEEDAPAATT